MARSRRLLVTLAGLALFTSLVAETGMTAQAGRNKNYLDSFNGGVAAILDPSAVNTTAVSYTHLDVYKRQPHLHYGGYLWHRPSE